MIRLITINNERIGPLKVCCLNKCSPSNNRPIGNLEMRKHLIINELLIKFISVNLWGLCTIFVLTFARLLSQYTRVYIYYNVHSFYAKNGLNKYTKIYFRNKSSHVDVAYRVFKMSIYNKTSGIPKIISYWLPSFCNHYHTCFYVFAIFIILSPMFCPYWSILSSKFWK